MGETEKIITLIDDQNGDGREILPLSALTE